MPRARIAALATVIALAAPAARAGSAAAPARLVFTAPSTCPDAAAFTAAVHERAPRAALTEASAARTFTVTIAQSPDGFAGTLAAPDNAAPRALAASRCDDLVAALALVTALAIDPEAGAGDAAIDDTSPPPARPTAPRAPGRGHLDALIAPELELGVAPEALPAAGLALRYTRAGLGHLDAGAVLGRDTSSTVAGGARFTWLVARVSPCWTAIDRAIAVDACAHVEAGELEAEGVNVVRAQDLRRSWLAAGAHASLRWRATSNIFAELQAGASVPFLRDRFYFTPNVFIHQAASVTPWVAVGVGVRFW